MQNRFQSSIWVLICISVLMVIFSVVFFSTSSTNSNHSNHSVQRSFAKDPLARLGNGTWIYLNLIVAKYPADPTQEDQTETQTLFSTILKNYPCEICRIHAIRYMENHPLTQSVFQTQGALKQWLIDFHNDVNRRCDKPSNYSVNQFDREWEQECAHCIDFV